MFRSTCFPVHFRVLRRFFSEVRTDVRHCVSKPDLTQEASLYVHWPYCLRRCSYCNFNKYIPKENKDNIMTECLQRETETLLLLSQVSCITSVFFGGGTPSLADPSTVSAVLETISKQASFSDQAEITLEVNPTPAGKMKLEGFHLAGVNRFSIGVQSLRDEDLRSLGRDHSSREALQTIKEARRLCPGRVSVDVMFGLPNSQLNPGKNSCRSSLLCVMTTSLCISSPLREAHSFLNKCKVEE
ncbi:hypothetical protein OJAV_G00079590 [Oryzias javanicus]|uniref:Radical SAM core domain-containing protein n=1 Tax=Oryzias javanicus TaxID=123683 RepID=A0A437D470_ORYJA|nr:hypothetical protein OJAV_G00079590 [Oryzias javanicus]